MTILEMCRQNYGRTWTDMHLQALVSRGKLTQEECDAVVDGTIADVSPEELEDLRQANNILMGVEQ